MGSNSDLFRLSYTVLPPAKEISLSRDGPPKNIPVFIIYISIILSNKYMNKMEGQAGKRTINMNKEHYMKVQIR